MDIIRPFSAPMQSENNTCLRCCSYKIVNQVLDSMSHHIYYSIFNMSCDVISHMPKSRCLTLPVASHPSISIPAMSPLRGVKVGPHPSSNFQDSWRLRSMSSRNYPCPYLDLFEAFPIQFYIGIMNWQNFSFVLYSLTSHGGLA